MKTPTAPVFDVQRFSVHDGPGIRSLVFFKGCNLACVWCQNPEAQQVSPLISFHAARCQGDFACARVCPSGAIARDGFRIISCKCTMCMRCVDACPSQALNVIGEYLDPDQLVEMLLADRSYYETSGGGVTFSGGEPTLYPAFMDWVLDLCIEQRLHTTLETCGTFSLKRWETILRKFNLIYFDLKIMDKDRHRQATGVGNERILKNARYLAAQNYPIEFRLILVPGYTDDTENLEAVVSFLNDLGLRHLHLLGYHRMGESKIDLIDGAQPKLGLESYTCERLAEVADWFAQRGILPPETG